MALTENTRLYEVLIRACPDGTFVAHQRFITEISRNGTVISASDGPALSLDIADVGDVLDEAFVNITNERDAAVAARNIMETERNQAREAKAGAIADLAQLSDQHTAALDEIQALRAQVTELQTESETEAN